MTDRDRREGDAPPEISPEERAMRQEEQWAKERIWVKANLAKVGEADGGFRAALIETDRRHPEHPLDGHQATVYGLEPALVYPTQMVREKLRNEELVASSEEEFNTYQRERERVVQMRERASERARAQARRPAEEERAAAERGEPRPEANTQQVQRQTAEHMGQPVRSEAPAEPRKK